MYDENLAQLLQDRGLEAACVAFPSSTKWPVAVVVAIYRPADRVPVQGYVYIYSNHKLPEEVAGYLAGRTAEKLRLRPGGETDLDIVSRADLPIAAATVGGAESAAARDAILVVAATEYLVKVGVLTAKDEELPPIPGNVH